MRYKIAVEKRIPAEVGAEVRVVVVVENPLATTDNVGGAVVEAAVGAREIHVVGDGFSKPAPVTRRRNAPLLVVLCRLSQSTSDPVESGQFAHAGGQPQRPVRAEQDKHRHLASVVVIDADGRCIAVR